MENTVYFYQSTNVKLLLDRRFFKTFILFLIVVNTPFFNGQIHKNTTDMKQPPYIANTDKFMMLLFHIDAVDAKNLVPDNVQLKIENGFATASLEIYKTKQVFGIPQYSLAFISLVVLDEKSGNNESGNWPIWGVVNDDSALQHFKTFYNFPYTLEKDISLTSKMNDHFSSVGLKSGEGLQLHLRKRDKQPVSAEGMAIIFNRSNNGDMIKIQIPWLAQGDVAVMVSFKINAGSNKVLNLLKNNKPFYGQISQNSFSYTKPELR